ncbi:LNX1 ligase, partial [Amia calva]|nr:LNX1 ligase [Amia calva]
MSQPDAMGKAEASLQDLCSVCGQRHLPEENHEYSYQDEVDDDLICHICLQPLTQPLDTPCGHTYCTECLTNFLLEKDFCPVDRMPLMLQTCKKSSILVHNLLDKLIVSCPFTEHCTETMNRCDLEAHLHNRCKGASHCGLSGDRKRRSQEGDCTDSTSELTIATLPSEIPASAAVALLTDDPGLVNPAFDPSVEDSQSGSSTSLAARSASKKIRNFDRTSVRSRSFKRLNRAFSVLRRTKSGNAVVAESVEERDNLRNAHAPQEVLALPQLHHLIPDGEITSIKINRANPSEALAISIVGGNETPLVRILIQDIYREGVIARDGRGAWRLHLPPAGGGPGLAGRTAAHQRQGAGHQWARPALWGSRACGSAHTGGGVGICLKAQINRWSPSLFSPPPESKEAEQKTSASKEGELFPLSVYKSKRLHEERVHFIVSRQTRHQTPDILQEAPWNMNGPPPYSPTAEEDEDTSKNVCHRAACYEKTVSLTKESNESLGMTVAGGMLSRGWDLPVYVTNVDPDGVVGREGSIKKGDILLNVNGIDLTGVTRGEALANLKNTSSLVVLKVLEMRHVEECETDGLPFSDANRNLLTSEDYSPPWTSWLQLPRHLYCCKDIVLRRSTSGSLGFSIVGGYEEMNCNQAFFIRSIVEGTPAYNDGRIRCGDMLLEVNCKGTSGMTHSALVRMLKELRGRITLTIVSWPGSLL